ncbi:MAG: glycosyltransferase family 9 protein [Gammaproteobacteria bacterium]|nr:glycosyltransferase family 9 protein [Gammaproteobacteria bacterium]
MPETPKNILIVRNDKLGDFMLAWPTFQFIKQAFPQSRIYALVPEYTRPMAEICPWIDEIIIDDAREGFSGLIKTTSKLRTTNVDAALNLHSTPRIALALLFAGIKHRFAPASRIDQVMYNHTLKQRRSRSEKPEYEYNTDLAAFMANYYGIDHSYTLTPPLLKFPKEEIRKIREKFYSENNIEADKQLVIVHAGSGGSATNLSIKQYAELIKLLSVNDSLFFVLTAGPGEQDIAQQLSGLISNCNHRIYYSEKGMVEFAKFVSIASFFISGSTGTLHIAGALDIPTVAFYPKRRSATSLRWQTLNSDKNMLSITLPDNNDSSDKLYIENTCKNISNYLVKHNR